MESHEPKAGVSAALFQTGRLLLVRRARPPFRDLWSLPGGRVEAGESRLAAIAREVMEETGLQLGDPRYVHTITQGGYDIAVFASTRFHGQARAGDDAAQIAWLTRVEAFARPTTPGLAKVVTMAARAVDTEF